MFDQIPAPRPRSALTSTDKALLNSVFGALWIVHLVNALLFGGALNAWGVAPRTFLGLFGILFAPLLHSGILHLLANTVFGYPLARYLMHRTKAEFVLVGLASALGSGALVWLLGSGLTVGFSGVLFGYLGYLFVLSRLGGRVGIQAPAPTPGSLLVALLFSLLPGISLMAHLGGFLSGGAMALLLLSMSRARGRRR